uniref:uncharacterized protein LOC120335973 n=1 Tax=Styela clava TaxID=7725 RepID=UPI00193994DE|nr:uncharacterized protein LOC120335973 [Styela clava]
MKMKKFAILFCILCWTRLSMSEKCVTSSFNFLGPDSYINYLGTLPRLVEFSSCQYVQRNSIGHVIGVLRSYSTEKNPKAMLQFGKMTETGAEMHIHLLGNEKIIKEARRGKPYSEMLWCVVIDTREKTQTVFLDGRQISVIHFKKLDPIPGGGELLLGKSRDKTLPGYQGSMRNIMMWARKLTSNEIRIIYKSGFCPDDAIIKMHRGNVQLHGSFGAEKQECTPSSHYFPGTGGYLQYKGTLPDLTNFTMCQYMGTNSDGHTNGVLRGYSTTSNKNAMLFYGKKTSNRNIIDVHMGGKIQSFLIPLSLPRNKEIFACQNFDMVSKKARLYMSGMAIFTKKFDIQPPVPGGGILFIGNSPDTNLPGCRGKVKNFMIWKRRLEDSEIADMFKSNLCPGDAIVTIHPGSVEKHGDVIQYGSKNEN